MRNGDGGFIQNPAQTIARRIVTGQIHQPLASECGPSPLLRTLRRFSSTTSENPPAREECVR